MAQPEVSFFARLVMFFVLPFQVLFDGARAHRVQQALPAAGGPDDDAVLDKLQDQLNELEVELNKTRKAQAAAEDKVADVEGKLQAATEEADGKLKALQAELDAANASDDSAALQLLGILQRDGRLVDFLMEDVSAYSDADIGGAARQVHEGCHKALTEYFELGPVRDEDEDAAIHVPEGFDAHLLRLTGNVSGKAPYDGRLAHPGWQATKRSLPELASKDYAHIIAPAEIEI